MQQLILRQVGIGDPYLGGILAYILVKGDPGYVASVQHGLIAATADADTEMDWSNITTTSVGTTGIAIGDGQTNTTLIVGQAGCTTGAAHYCDTLNEGGYTDWFLPSKDELNKLYLNKVAIGGFAVGFYWSSSEYVASYAWYQLFNDSGQDFNPYALGPCCSGFLTIYQFNYLRVKGAKPLN